MAKVTICLSEEENAAIEEYTERGLTKQNACHRLVRRGLINMGLIKPTAVDEEMGLNK